MKKILLQASFICLSIFFFSSLPNISNAGLREDLELARAVISRHQSNQNGHDDVSRYDLFTSLKDCGSAGVCNRCCSALTEAESAIREASYKIPYDPWDQDKQFHWRKNMKRQFVFSILQDIA